MAKINGLDNEQMEELESLDEDRNDLENTCDRCSHYEKCYSNGGEVPNHINCFLDDDEDIFFESDETKKEYTWKEMSYNKYKES